MITSYPRYPEDLKIEIARGNIPGASSFYTFGQMSISSNTLTYLSETGMPELFTVPDNIQLTLVSGSSNDTQDVKVVYLDGSLNVQEETVTLNGTTSITTNATDIRAIDTIYSLDGPFEGSIDCTSGGTRYAYIPEDSMIQYNTTVRRVPAGKRLMVSTFFAGASSGNSDASCILRLETTSIRNDSFGEQGYFHPLTSVALQDNSTTLSDFGPFAIPSGEWIAVSALADKSAEVTAGIFGWLEDENGS